MEILILLGFIFYFTEAYQLFAVGSYGFTHLDGITFLLIIAAFKRVLWDGEKIKFAWHGATTAFSILMLSLLISIINPLLSGEQVLIFQFIKSSSHLIFTASFAFILIFFPPKISTWEKVIKIWLIISIIINIFGAYQIFARAFDLPLAWLDYTNVSFTTRGSLESMEDYQQLSLHFGDFYRATSIFSEPSALGGFNIFIMSFLIVPYVQKKKPFFLSKILNTIIFVSSIMGLFLAFSITGIVGLSMVMLSIFIIEKFKPIKIFTKFIVALSILVVIADGFIVSYLGTSVLELFGRRLVGIVMRDSAKGKHTPGESFEGRVDNIFQSIEIWERYPVFGIGIGNIHYNETTDISFSTYYHLALLAETGLLGFFTGNWLFITLFITTFKFIKFPDKYSGLSPPHQRINGLLFYIMLQLFLTNYISGNNLGQTWLWLPASIVITSISQTIIATGKGKIYQIQLLKTPLKRIFAIGVKNYNFEFEQKRG